MKRHPSNVSKDYLKGDSRRLAARLARQSLGFFATLTTLFASSPAVFAGEIPTASANAELVAFAGALEYAQSPQVSISVDHTGEASLRRRSLTYIAREFAHLVVRDIRRSLREDAGERRPMRARVRTHYDLRVSDDKFVVRLKYRF